MPSGIGLTESALRKADVQQSGSPNRIGIARDAMRDAQRHGRLVGSELRAGYSSVAAGAGAMPVGRDASLSIKEGFRSTQRPLSGRQRGQTHSTSERIPGEPSGGGSGVLEASRA